MFNGGIVTIFVTDMNRSVRFYTEQLGLKLLQRYENHFATVDAGHGLTLGLHPTSASAPASAADGEPRKSGISIGLYLTGTLKEAVANLQARGVTFDGPVLNEGKAGSFAHFTDPDGNPLYLAEMKPEYKDDAVGVR
jgi:catechol 2,3-dioxygenase-like lactoylglutathione lyase family enzyme